MRPLVIVVENSIEYTIPDISRDQNNMSHEPFPQPAQQQHTPPPAQAAPPQLQPDRAQDTLLRTYRASGLA